MLLTLPWSTHHLDIEVPDPNLIPLLRPSLSPALPDAAAAVRTALEHPVDYPPLRRALTPEDQIAIVIDENLPQLPRLLVPLLEHLSQALIAAEAITLVCLPPSTGQPWLEDLPEAFQDIHIEIHQPDDRTKLSYLATTRRGRRIYLNRTAVDADQLIVLSRRTFDPLLGIGGGEGLIFPALADEPTRKEIRSHVSLDVPGEKNWPIRQQAVEVSWLLGAPFLVQVIPDTGAEIAGIIAGPVASSGAGQRLLEARWRVEVDRPADVVIATLSGPPERHGLLELASALHSAARIVKPGGKIVLLTGANPELAPSFDFFRTEDDPAQAVKQLLRVKPDDLQPALLWASAAEQAHLYLLSQMPAETVEELFATPLESVSQVQRFLGPDVSCVVLPDADKTLAVLRSV